MNSNEFAFMSVARLATEIRNKNVSPVEVIEACIDRIEKRNRSLNAFVFTDFDRARKMARESEKRIMQGEGGTLEGVPTAIKDLFDGFENWPNTSGGIPCLKNYASSHMNIYAERMLKAGAIPVGKTNSPTMGFRGTCDNPLFGATSNPFDLSRNSGGSSGGSAAAVADGLVPLAEGTDGGGSIRIPAAWCGVFGYKASLGTVPFICRPNAFGATNPFFFEMALTRTVEDAAIAMNVLAGAHEDDPHSIPCTHNYLDCMKGSIEGKRIAYTRDFGIFPVENEVAASVEACLDTFRTLGAVVEEVPFRINSNHLDLANAWCRLIVMSAMEEVEALREKGIDLLNDYADDLSPELRKWIEIGYRTTLKEYLEDQRLRTLVYDAIQAVLGNYDYIISPTLCCSPVLNDVNRNTLGPATVNGEPVERLIGWCMTYFTNFTGHPSASVPAGLTEAGLPVGLQIIGKRFDDIGVLRASYLFESVKPWDEIYSRPKERPLEY